MIRLYLDGAATTFPLESLKQKMTNAYWLNPSSPYEQAISVRESVEEARRFLLSLLTGSANVSVAVNPGAVNPGGLGMAKSGNSVGVVKKNEKTAVFTSGGTESNNMAIVSAVELARKRLKIRKTSRIPHVLISSVEHPSVYEFAKYLESRGEITLALIPANPDASLNLHEVDFSSCDVVCTMAVNNEIGTVTDITALRREMEVQTDEAHRPYLVVDGVQTLGKIPFSQVRAFVEASDFFTVSAHKIHGFKGTGAIVARPQYLSPLHIGGGQEFGLRGGTENTVGILAFHEALRALSKNCDDAYFNEAFAARNQLVALIASIGGIHVNTPLENWGSTPFITSISFEGVKSEVLLHHLAGNGYLVSNGSACSTKKLEVSRILKSCKIPTPLADGTIRVGFSPAYFYDPAKCNCLVDPDGEWSKAPGKETKRIDFSKKLSGFVQALEAAVAEIRMLTGYRPKNVRTR